MSKRNGNPAGRQAGKTAARRRAERRVEIMVDGTRMVVPPILKAAVLRAKKALDHLPAEMTTTQAADFLDVSRPFIIKLVERSELPCRMVGKHRRIPTTALREYREKMFRQATKACDEMTEIAQRLGLYELEGQRPKKS